eukprot:6198581-Pleurochrysis_carterae.AAC.3
MLVHLSVWPRRRGPRLWLVRPPCSLIGKEEGCSALADPPCACRRVLQELPCALLQSEGGARGRVGVPPPPLHPLRRAAAKGRAGRQAEEAKGRGRAAVALPHLPGD